MTCHIRYDSSGRVVSSSQRPLPDIIQHSRQTYIHAPSGIRIHNLSRRAATDLRLRPHGHWDRLLKAENILQMVQRSPRLSTRRMASRIGVSRMQVWRTLHEEDLYPYHDQRVQHLEPGDNAQRMDLCHWIKAHPEMLIFILFSDELSFTRDGVNYLRNVHTSSHDNPHETSVSNFQRRFTVNVWCGVLVTSWSDLLSLTTI